ncbi:MAG: hypothetical protein HY282_13775 [Nitrospirae bacterium]|nr:hypothetical protein [Candidatus Manganitrophaceae bacterium]
MRRPALSLFLLLLIGLSTGPTEPGTVGEEPTIDTNALRYPVVPIGTIIPQPSETFSDEPTPVKIRIVNRGTKPIYLQGFRQGKEQVQIYLYHREAKGGWKPFFDSLPCDLPTCRTLHAPPKACPKPTPFVVKLGPMGNADSIREVSWGGFLYQRSEATQEDRGHRYCYKGSVPKAGRMRVEVEFSDSIQRGGEKNGIIGARDHAVIEFDLPPSQPQYDIVIK